MIEDLQPLSAEEISHVIPNLENLLFHIVPSKFISPYLTLIWPYESSYDLKLTLKVIKSSGGAWACVRLVWWTVECVGWENGIDQWMITTSQRRIWIQLLWINQISLATSSGCFHFQVQHLENIKIWRFVLIWLRFDPDLTSIRPKISYWYTIISQ